MSASTATGASDASLIERSATRPEEFALIFDRHAPTIHAYLRRRIGPPMEDRVAERVDANASYRILAGVLGKLSRGERDTILLYAWAGLSYEEIAHAMDVPVGTVRSRLHRARRQLRAALERTNQL